MGTVATPRPEVVSFDARVPQSAPPSVSEAWPDPWPLWQRVLFRFFFIYLLLQVEPWDWFRAIPGVPWLLRPYGRLVDWAVHASNAGVFHVRDTLVMVNGSGDTSWAWTQVCLYLTLAAVGCVVWSLLDRRRTQYDRLAFWLRMIVRYYIAAAALSYGIIKLFLLQMPFPSLSQLATPLGDLLPMRFSWLFIGYSAPYQFFSGVMETTAGLLLLYRRTVTAGLFAATGAFLNVAMINLSYDVPVKLYAAHLLFACLFLLALDAPRLVRLLVLNQPVPATTAYDPKFAFAWQRWGSIGVKLFLLFQFLVVPWKSGWQRSQALKVSPAQGPFVPGFYDVRRYVVNRDTIVASTGDTLRWRDVIIDNNGAGSINTSDQVFWQRYHRGYFRYKPNPASHTAAVWKTSAIPRDSTFLFTMRYEVPDSTTIRLHTVIRGDSVHVELVRVPRHFQLAERQFHWLSEYNR
ncbi:MAG TPA: hypothetical protein VGP95_16010 [Gemmatimonadaceae bacterium]|nr:hypothetical protein [Gemmatimonadaceae bacterium]